MRVLFIYPDLGSFLPRHFQHGLGFLSAVLKKAGHTTRLFYISEPWSKERLVEETRSFAPGLVCLSGTSHQYRHLARIAEWIKSALPSIPVICGGVHAMLASEQVIAHPGIDMVCRGEGEDALLELVHALEQGKEYHAIKNLWVKWKGELVRNQLRPLVQELDSLPFPDRELFEHQAILDQDDRRLSLLVGRGCPYDCSYCANQAKRRLYQGMGKYVRLRSVDNLLAEIELCAEKYELRRLDFNDDIFTLNRAWLDEFCAKYPQKFSWPFRINVHAGTVDPELFRKLAAIGAEMVRVGVESGSERVRRQIMNRSLRQEEIEKSFQWAEQAGIRTWSFNMVGLPGENAEDALATYNLNRRLCPDHMQVSVFNPYPGTRLFEICREQNYIRGELTDGYFIPQSALDFPSLRPAEIHNWHQRLMRLSMVCRNHNALKRRLASRIMLFDLIDELYRAEVFTPVPDYYGEEHLIIYEESRRALVMHPPCRIRFQLELPEKASFSFGIMMHPGIYERGERGGVKFFVRAGKSASWLEDIFSHRLNAKARKEDRGFFDFEADLSRFSPGRLFLELATEAGDPEHNRFNTAGFTNPVIVAKCPEMHNHKSTGG